jgi:hypothetical protein
VQDRKNANFAELLKVSGTSKDNNIEQMDLWAIFEEKGKDKDYIIGQVYNYIRREHWTFSRLTYLLSACTENDSA